MLSELFSKIRLFTLWGKKPYFLLYKVLGFIPDNINIYIEALSHGSANVSRKSGEKINNERLEFLGDTILDSIISDILYRKYPNEREGFLSNMRASIVQRKSLNHIAQEMNIRDILSIAGDISLEHNHIGGNALEALVGAIYIDKGYSTCYKFVNEKIITPFVDLEKLAITEENYKSRLMEWGQKNRADIDYICLTAIPKAGTIMFSNLKFTLKAYLADEGKVSQKKRHNKMQREKPIN